MSTKQRSSGGEDLLTRSLVESSGRVVALKTDLRAVHAALALAKPYIGHSPFCGGWTQGPLDERQCSCGATKALDAIDAVLGVAETQINFDEEKADLRAERDALAARVLELENGAK